MGFVEQVYIVEFSVSLLWQQDLIDGDTDVVEPWKSLLTIIVNFQLFQFRSFFFYIHSFLTKYALDSQRVFTIN
jgi:hypothetical protein